MTLTNYHLKFLCKIYEVEQKIIQTKVILRNLNERFLNFILNAILIKYLQKRAKIFKVNNHFF